MMNFLQMLGPMLQQMQGGGGRGQAYDSGAAAGGLGGGGLSSILTQLMGARGGGGPQPQNPQAPGAMPARGVGPGALGGNRQALQAPGGGPMREQIRQQGKTPLGPGQAGGGLMGGLMQLLRGGMGGGGGGRVQPNQAQFRNQQMQKRLMQRQGVGKRRVGAITQ